MTKTQRTILGPLATSLARRDRRRWSELKGYINRYYASDSYVLGYAIEAYLRDAKRLLSELPDSAKGALATGRFSEQVIAGFAFVLIEEVVRRADVAARRSMD
jgi:hypothetical protein